ncbi:hypothetical protein GCM10010336_70600 [Streptomyces goshikiensis]|nr:hypothetical protein GCM10010336_70600 [Streptomyces goshikiensis]
MAPHAITLTRAIDTPRRAAERRLIRMGSPEISATRRRPSARGSAHRGPKRKSSGRSKVRTAEATTAAAIGQRVSARTAGCGSGSCGWLVRFVAEESCPVTAVCCPGSDGAVRHPTSGAVLDGHPVRGGVVQRETPGDRGDGRP